MPTETCGRPGPLVKCNGDSGQLAGIYSDDDGYHDDKLEAEIAVPERKD